MIALAAALLLAAIPPAPATYVTDNVHALSSDTRDRLENRLRAFDAKTGDQLIVWIGDTTGSEPLETFTVDAAQKWRVGKKGKDNGAILFLFMRDHRVRIEVGYGLEPTLTDARSDRIINQTIVPLMKKGDTDAAVEGGVSQMIATIDPSFAVPSPSASPESGGDDDAMAGLAVLAVFLIVGGGLIFALIVTIVRRGKKHGDWLDAWMFSGSAGGTGYSERWGSGDSGGGFSGFSGGGGSFGGGGASGSW